MRMALVALLAASLLAPQFAVADETQVEPRLRGCLLTGASSAPKTSLSAALQSTRAFCGPQIKAVARQRVEAATAGLNGEAAEEAEKRAIRDLNNEIAYAVANFTGLTL